MKRFATPHVGTILAIGLALPLTAFAQQCPPELAQAKARITALQAAGSPKEVTAPRSLAGARLDSVEAPRGQSVQAPRDQNVQAPRLDSVEAPRGQSVQAPRDQNVQAPRLDSVEAPRGQNVQAPRLDSVEAPRDQNVQAPRDQNVQAPRLDSVEAPRDQNVQAPRTAAGARQQSPTQAQIERAMKLISESEQACQAGNMSLSSAKAKTALEALK